MTVFYASRHSKALQRYTTVWVRSDTACARTIIKIACQIPNLLQGIKQRQECNTLIRVEPVCRDL